MNTSPESQPTAPDWFAIRAARHAEMEAERHVCFSKSLGRWCLTNGFARILGTAITREAAQALTNYKPAEQLPPI